MPPQFLVVGHAVQDLDPEGGEGPDGPPSGWRLGGTVAYAALLARRLGLSAAVLTAAGPEMRLAEALPGVELAVVPSKSTTAIRNVYTERGRVQHIPRRAAAIGPNDLPAGWREAEIVLLGPVAGEIDTALAARFPRALVGACVQGWLRDIDAEGRVRARPPDRWDARPLLEHARVLFASDEDLPDVDARRVLERWGETVEIVAFTHAERGAEVLQRGDWRRLSAFPSAPLDPTGAGDVFATAFLVRYHETGDAGEAARFACCASSFIIEGVGAANTPDREAIGRRLREHPEIAAR